VLPSLDGVAPVRQQLMLIAGLLAGTQCLQSSVLNLHLATLVIAHDFMDNFHFYSFLNGLLVTYLLLHSIRYHTSKTFESTTLIVGDY